MKYVLFTFAFVLAFLCGCEEQDGAKSDIDNQIIVEKYNSLDQAIEEGLNKESGKNKKVLDRLQLGNELIVLFLADDFIGNASIKEEDGKFIWNRTSPRHGMENVSSAKTSLITSHKTESGAHYYIVLGRVPDQLYNTVQLSINRQEPINLPIDSNSRFYYYLAEETIRNARVIEYLQN